MKRYRIYYHDGWASLCKPDTIPGNHRHGYASISAKKCGYNTLQEAEDIVNLYKNRKFGTYFSSKEFLIIDFETRKIVKLI